MNCTRAKCAPFVSTSSHDRGVFHIIVPNNSIEENFYSDDENKTKSPKTVEIKVMG